MIAVIVISLLALGGHGDGRSDQANQDPVIPENEGLIGRDFIGTTSYREGKALELLNELRPVNLAVDIPVVGIKIGGSITVQRSAISNFEPTIIHLSSSSTQLFSSNGQFLMDDFVVKCHLSYRVIHHIGEQMGISLVSSMGGPSGAIGRSEKHSFEMTDDKCIRKFFLEKDDTGRKLGLPYSVIVNFCDECTRGRMRKLETQIHAREKLLKLHLRDTTCSVDDDCHAEAGQWSMISGRSIGRCVLHKELDTKNQPKYYRRCEPRMTRGAYCTGAESSPYFPRKCDAGLRCQKISDGYRRWDLHWEYARYRCE